MSAAVASNFDPDEALHTLLFTEDGGRDPYPTYAALREHHPVHRSANGPVWALTRYEDCYAVLRDTRFAKGPVNFRDLFTARVEGYADIPPLVTAGSIVFMNPPEHTRVRGFVNRAFTPRRVEELRPYVVTLTDRLLDGVAGAGRGDLAESVAFELPIDVIGELVGVPRDERGHVRTIVSEAVALFDPLATVELVDEGVGAARRLGGYFSDLVRRVRRAGDTAPDNLISALLRQQGALPPGDRLRPSELVSTITVLFGAGFESTAYLIATGLYTLLRNEEAVDRLSGEPAALDGAVEEALRYESVFQVSMRAAREPVEVGGQHLAPGDWVVPFLGAANHDPAVFRDPDSFDIARSPNHHVAFSSGVHHCLGAALARLEIAVAFERVVARFDATLDDAEPAPVWRSFPFRKIDRLPVCLEPR